MTERRWRTSTDSLEMFEFFRGTRLDSRLRRFAVECCRRVRHLITDETFRAAADAGEAFADDPHNKKSTIKPMAAASIYGWRQLRRYAITADPHRLCAARAAIATCASTDWHAAFHALQAAARALNRADADRCNRIELEWQADILRCIFGNPFHPVALEPSWLTWNDGTVAKLAHSIYDDRAFNLLPVLADALEEAGCDNADILDHCRRPGEHVRGCWVVDLVLGRA